MPTIVGISTFMSRSCWHFNIYEQEKNRGILTLMSKKNSILGLSEPEKAIFLGIFILWSI